MSAAATELVRRLRTAHDKLRDARDATGGGLRLNRYGAAKQALEESLDLLHTLHDAPIALAEQLSAAIDDALDELARFYAQFDEARKVEHLLQSMKLTRAAARLVTDGGLADASAWLPPAPPPSRRAPHHSAPPRVRFAAAFPAPLSALGMRLRDEEVARRQRLAAQASARLSRPSALLSPPSTAPSGDLDAIFADVFAADSAAESSSTAAPPHLRAQAAAIVAAAGARFAKERHMPSLTRVAEALVVAAGLVSSIAHEQSSSPFGEFRAAFSRGQLSPERPRERAPSANASVFQAGCLQHDMATLIIHGIAATPELRATAETTARLPSAMNEGAGTIAKAMGLTPAVTFELYLGAFELYKRDRSESLRNWQLDHMAISTLAGLVGALTNDRPRAAAAATSTARRADDPSHAAHEPR